MKAPQAFVQWCISNGCKLVGATYGSVEKDRDAIYVAAIEASDHAWISRELKSAVQSLADEEAESDRLQSRVRDLEAALGEARIYCQGNASKAYGERCAVVSRNALRRANDEDANKGRFTERLL